MKTIIIRAKERTKKTGEKFMTYNARKKDGTWMRAKIRKDATQTPKTEGMFEIDCDEKNMSVSVDDYGEVLWMGGEITVRPYAREVDPRVEQMF